MKWRWPDAVVLFVLGAVASLIGDHGHTPAPPNTSVDTVPFVWSSPVWFPLLVAVATVSLAEIRLHVLGLRTTVTARQGLAGVVAVVGIYVTTALVQPTFCSAPRRGSCPVLRVQGGGCDTGRDRLVKAHHVDTQAALLRLT